ncbi:lysoplasmalogenase [Dactylosporangium sp. AC04546]|uniref:lysoplasmalogenase n=1 Tax=Dactylosporangium sp. AC04546 TaxID=2862460 RepID=UPI001EE056A1|nr:lysoplasmalogenase [Dactylosporangium sp. AC04546]WVK82432.1 lysoplasmalogenase [Dactylosporangium sp. AC04546]
MSSRAPLWLFAVAACVELVGVALDERAIQWASKPLLAPLLLWYLWSRRDIVATGLAFAFAGDVALLVPGQVWFLLGMACFLGTQLCFLVAFRRSGRPSTAVLVAAAILWAGLNALLWSRLGPLRVPILAYSLALTAMAAWATAVSARVAAGAVLFLLSDLLIGVGAAGMDFAGRDLVVMSTYAAALALIATGWAARRSGAGATAGSAAPPVPHPPR